MLHYHHQHHHELTFAGLVSEAELLDPGLLAGLLAGLLLGLAVGVLVGDPPLEGRREGGRRLAHDGFADAAAWPDIGMLSSSDMSSSPSM